MGHITAELTKGWMMEGIGMQVILGSYYHWRWRRSLDVNAPASVIPQV